MVVNIIYHYIDCFFRTGTFVNKFFASREDIKPTNINPCSFNFQSECPSCYERTIIKTCISRVELVSSLELSSLKNLNNIKQTLINNGFPNYNIDTENKHFIDKAKQHNIDNILNLRQAINVYDKPNFLVIIR